MLRINFRVFQQVLSYQTDGYSINEFLIQEKHHQVEMPIFNVV